jgi:exodeoxyribonuclease VII small subunit
MKFNKAKRLARSPISHLVKSTLETSDMEAKTFREAYTVLQGHAETLREQTEPNIDDLLSIVTESVAAYKVCKARIDAVEKALQEALTDVGADAGLRGGSSGGSGAEDREDGGDTPVAAPRRSGARPAPKGKTGFDDMDDDIPF